MQRYFVLASLAIFFVAAGRWVWLAAGSSAWGPRIECQQREVYAGECWIGETLECDFDIKNIGFKDLKIVAVQPGCDCTSASVSVDTVEPNSVATIHVTIKAKGPEGRFRQQVLVATNDLQIPQLPLVITGSAKSNFRVMPRKISIVPGVTDNLPKIQIVSAHPSEELQDISLDVTIPGIKAHSARMEDGKGIVVNLQWDARAHAAQDSRIGYLQIQTNNSVEPSIRIPISVGVGKSKKQPSAINES